MQSISLHDVIEISPAPELSLSSTSKELSSRDNLAFKAAELLQSMGSTQAGANINVIKRIPIAAGLAGGSADAAATLIGLNMLWDLKLSVEELQKIGAKLGADIPFCLVGGTALAEGKGEIITSLNPMPKLWMVLVTPPIRISTAEVYRLVDEREIAPLYTGTEFLDALSSGDIIQISAMLKNLLEEVVLPLHTEIDGIKKLAISAGGSGALMSGSGPSVFVICRDEAEANRIADDLRLRDEMLFVETVRPVDRGIEIQKAG